MSIEVSCDECGRDFRVSDASAGKRVKCSCGAAVRVPDDDFDDEPAPRRRPSAGKRKASRDDDSMNGVLIGGLVGGGLAFVALVVGGIWLLGGKQNQPAPPVAGQPVPLVPTVPTPAVAHTTPTTPTTPTQPPAVPPTTPPGTQAIAPTVAAPVAARSDSNWDGLESRVQVAHRGNDSKVAFAPGGKFIAIDRAIYEMNGGEEVWAAPAAFGGGSKTDVLAVSPNGNLLAEADDKGATLTVYAKEKIGDEDKVELPVPNEKSNLAFLQFAADTKLVAAWGARGGCRVAVFDVEKPKKPLKEFNTESFSMKSGTISGDGKFLALASVQSLKVYDLSKGTSVATMATPAVGGPLVFNGCSGLAFSPNNEELAAALGSSVVVWSNRGKIIEEFPEVTPANPFSKSNNLSYLPDGSGWLVHGQALFDRAREIVVWQLQSPFASQHPAMVLDAEHLLVSGGSGNNGQIAAVKIPTEEIAKATKAMESNAEAVLAPGKQISIAYEIGEPRFSSRVQVVNELNESLTKRLAQFGITVAENQPVTMKVVYTEAPGNTVEYSEGRGFGPPIPRPFGGRSPFDKPGTQVVETKHSFSATLFRKDDPRSWWSATLVQNGPQSLKGDITEQNIRNGSFENMKHSVGSIVLPRYLPVDQEVPVLPIRSDLGKL